MRLFDAHCHLQDERLAPGLDDVLARARAAGVAGFCCCGAAEGDWAAVADLRRAHVDVVAAYGLHPWYVRARTPQWRETLVRRLEDDPGAAVGEIGLDHALEERDDADQAAVFAEQLALARDLNRPACVHCRRAWGTLLELLDRGGAPRRGFLVHSYSGSPELIPALARHGARFSFSGSVTWPGNRRARRCAAAVPEERLLIETDAPDLYPYVAGAPADGPRPPNEPALLLRVLREVALLRGADDAALAERTWSNAAELFASGGG